ncbi:MAG TPA: hypothetical protein VN653_16405, partial [Anaerolineales bacterium]|nr:hypothetical protein [Anaerolineales bacterium]
THNGQDGLQVDASCAHLTGGVYTDNGQYGLNLTTTSLDLITSPTFANNTLGDMFPAAPVSCSVPLASGGGTPSTPSTPGTPAVSPQNVVTLNSSASTVNPFLYAVALNSAGVSLNSILTNTQKADGRVAVQISAFWGKYIYSYSAPRTASSIDGIQIISLIPSSLTDLTPGGS